MGRRRELTQQILENTGDLLETDPEDARRLNNLVSTYLNVITEEDKQNLPGAIGNLVKNTEFAGGEELIRITEYLLETGGVSKELNNLYGTKKVDLNNEGLVSIINYVEKNDKSLIPSHDWEELRTEGYEIPSRQEVEFKIDENTPEEKIRLKEAWETLVTSQTYMSPINETEYFWDEIYEMGTRKVFKYLIEKQEENGSFRNWLEEQEETKKVKTEFERLGLNYEAWDNPRIQFGLGKNRKTVKKIELDKESIIQEVQELTRKLTRGEYQGHLTMKPKQFWKKIAPMYQQLEEKYEENIDNLMGEIEKGIKISRKKGTIEKDLKNIKSKVNGDASKDNAYRAVMKVWERRPSTDMLEGNDAGLCLEFPDEESEYVANYLVDKTISLVDVSIKGKRKGHIMYIAGVVDEKPTLIVEDFDMSKSQEYEDQEDLLRAGYDVTMKIAEEAGFKQVIFQNYNHHHFSGEFRNYVRKRNNLEKDQYIMDKIGNTEPLKILEKIEYPSKGIHYFDTGGGSSCYEWQDTRIEGYKVDVKPNNKKTRQQKKEAAK